MTLAAFWEMTLTACITVWSPGPNNIFLLSSASRYGIRKNLKFMLGIWTGSLSLMVASGIFCSTLAAIVPGIQPVMKYIGALYLLYLAWQTARRLPPGENHAEQVPTYPMGILLQLVNVKIIIYGLTMFSSFILPYENRPPVLFCFAFYLMVIGAVGNLIWAFAGNVLQRIYTSHYRMMNIIMALLVLWCAFRVLGVL